jgi:hypothetical protein
MVICPSLALFDMVSYLHSLASSPSLDQVPFHPSSPITIPQICEIRPHVLGSALVWGQEGIRGTPSTNREKEQQYGGNLVMEAEIDPTLPSTSSLSL